MVADTASQDNPGRRRQLILLVGLLRRQRLNDVRDLGNAIGGKTSTLGMLTDQFLIGCQINAVDLVASHIAVNPLNIST